MLDIAPFPTSHLPQAWTWFKDSLSLMNRANTTVGEFCTWAQGADSWAITDCGEPIGIVLFEPVIWPGTQAATDGFITFALCRKAWGKSVLPSIRKPLLHEIFTHYPLVRRVTGYTSVRNVPAQNAALALGCELEGRLRDVTDGGDVFIYGLTRTSFYGKRP